MVLRTASLIIFLLGAIVIENDDRALVESTTFSQMVTAKKTIESVRLPRILLLLRDPLLIKRIMRTCAKLPQERFDTGANYTS